MDDATLVECQAAVWASIDALAVTLSATEWKTPTDCPGWTVQDNLAHIVGIESSLLGREAPAAAAVDAPHVKNDLGRSNEAWVDSFRNRSGATVLTEFREVTASRLAVLRDPATDFGADAWTPIGPGTVRDQLPFRVFDAWVHEQDMRRAVGRPGGWDNAAAAAALERIVSLLPMVVGKRVAPPEGAVVVVSIGGPVERELVVGITGGRAAFLDVVPATVTVRIKLDGDTFLRLGTGRGDVDEILASGAVVLEGDADLGAAVARAMNFVP